VNHRPRSLVLEQLERQYFHIANLPEEEMQAKKWKTKGIVDFEVDPRTDTIKVFVTNQLDVDWALRELKTKDPFQGRLLPPSAF
jgi:hypothetical protein